MDIVVIMKSQDDLLLLVRTSHSSGGFACRLDGRQQKSDEHSDNRNDDEKFDKGEGIVAPQAFAPPIVGDGKKGGVGHGFGSFLLLKTVVKVSGGQKQLIRHSTTVCVSHCTLPFP